MKPSEVIAKVENAVSAAESSKAGSAVTAFVKAHLKWVLIGVAVFTLVVLANIFADHSKKSVLRFFGSDVAPVQCVRASDFYMPYKKKAG